jgi:hypothetical protein
MMRIGTIKTPPPKPTMVPKALTNTPIINMNISPIGIFAPADLRFPEVGKQLIKSQYAKMCNFFNMFNFLKIIIVKRSNC